MFASAGGDLGHGGVYVAVLIDVTAGRRNVTAGRRIWTKVRLV
jgi:hypothetical protein